jgi:SAM-dependent methyltransferase
MLSWISMPRIVLAGSRHGEEGEHAPGDQLRGGWFVRRQRAVPSPRFPRTRPTVRGLVDDLRPEPASVRRWCRAASVRFDVVDPSHRARHASSFGAAAAAYAEHRPDYAPAAVRWALGPASGMRVLELGAGTGKLTASLAALGAEPTAVEPDAAMLAELRRALPGVRALPGSAEAIPLPDASVDVVVAGNAMHWFDMDVAGPEIARVLAPGGVMCGL